MLGQKSGCAMGLAERIAEYRGGLIPLALANAVLLNAPFMVHYYDYRYFLEWYEIAAAHGPLQVYAHSLKTAYFPLAVSTFLATHSAGEALSRLLGLAGAPISPITLLIDKLPYILAFNAIFFLLKREFGLKAGLYWLASAASYVTILLFQIDLLPTLLILLAFLETSRGRLGRSFLYTALAALYKQIFAAFFLVPLAAAVRERGLRRALCLLAVYGALPIALACAPFAAFNPLVFAEKTLLFHASRYPQELSLWALPMYLTRYDLGSVPPFFSWAWAVPLAAYMAYLLYSMLRAGDLRGAGALKYYLAVGLGLLVFNKVGGENYFTWVVPLWAALLARGSPPNRRALERLYVAIPLWILVVMPFTTQFAAAVVGGDIFIVEDEAWEPAEGLLASSMGYSSWLYSLVVAFRASPALYFAASALYSVMPYTMAFMAILYNASLAYALASVLRWRAC